LWIAEDFGCCASGCFVPATDIAHLVRNERGRQLRRPLASTLKACESQNNLPLLPSFFGQLSCKPPERVRKLTFAWVIVDQYVGHWA